jgi:hypothetical protein
MRFCAHAYHKSVNMSREKIVGNIRYNSLAHRNCAGKSATSVEADRSVQTAVEQGPVTGWPELSAELQEPRRVKKKMKVLTTTVQLKLVWRYTTIICKCIQAG